METDKTKSLQPHTKCGVTPTLSRDEEYMSITAKCPVCGMEATVFCKDSEKREEGIAIQWAELCDYCVKSKEKTDA